MTEKTEDKLVDPNWKPPIEGDEAPKGPDPVEELKAQLENERAARAEAERRANEEAQRAHKATVDKVDNELQMVLTAIDRVKESSDQLEAAYGQALAAQDFTAAARIQREMSSNEAKLLQLENGKAAMEARPKPQAPQPIRPTNPVEALASQLTPRSASWVRAHPEYATDSRLYQKMLAAHNLAVADGISPDTDDYFRSVEGTLGIGRRASVDDSQEDATSAAARPVRETAPPAAPPSRGNGSTSRTARLSAEEAEIAELSGMTPEEYARNREALKKEGRYH